VEDVRFIANFDSQGLQFETLGGRLHALAGSVLMSSKGVQLRSSLHAIETSRRTEFAK
jgi:hypothetical protein